MRPSFFSWRLPKPSWLDGRMRLAFLSASLQDLRAGSSIIHHRVCQVSALNSPILALLPWIPSLGTMAHGTNRVKLVCSREAAFAHMCCLQCGSWHQINLSLEPCEHAGLLLPILVVSAVYYSGATGMFRDVLLREEKQLCPLLFPLFHVLISLSPSVLFIPLAAVSICNDQRRPHLSFLEKKRLLLLMYF